MRFVKRLIECCFPPHVISIRKFLTMLPSRYTLLKFWRAITKLCVNLYNVNSEYVRDYIKFNNIRSSSRTDAPFYSVTGDHMWPAWKLFKFLSILFHYILLVVLMLDTTGWYVFAFWFFILEIVLFFLWPVFKDVWIVRLPFTFILFAAANSSNPNDYLFHLIEFSGLSSTASAIHVHNEMVELHMVFIYKLYYFLVIFLPYYFETLILVLPICSAAALMLFGYLIGYVWATYIATTLIFITFICAGYLIFFYPIVFDKFVWYLVHGGFHRQTNSDFDAEGNFSGDVFYSEIFKFFNNDSSPFADINILNVINTNAFNLYIDYGAFINTPFLWANFDFVLDSISILVVFTITFISTCVHLYSIVYMKSDPHIIRFFAFLSLFTFFMLVLVCANNLIMLYIGWEGVGLSSFLLIAFWFTRAPAIKAALKAVLVNKIGDMFLVLAASFIVHFTYGSTIISILPFNVVEKAAGVIFFGNCSALDCIAIFIVLAAFVKSAQLFFHTWLADAMEGPTPVSALLHAATMVTAGVYLVIRFSHIIEFSSIAKSMLFFGGLYTIIVSSLIALVQYDIKKIIAYSTCSQLGLMFFACGVSAYDLALYHFFNHAFFKCLLFLLAGAIIHELKNEQDIRRMGGLAKKMPFIFLCFLAASLSLIGFPGFSGAVSKDLILHLVNYSAQFHSGYTAFFLYATNLIIYLTIAYTARLIFYVFFKPSSYTSNALKKNYTDVCTRESIYAAIFFLLALMSVVGGWAFKNFFIFTDFYFIDVKGEILVLNPDYFSFWYDNSYKFITYFVTLHGIFGAVWFYFYIDRSRPVWYPENNKFFYAVYQFFNKKCYFDDAYNLIIVHFFIKLSYIYNRLVEDGLFRTLTLSMWTALFYPYRPLNFPFKNSMLSHLFYVNFCLILMSWLTYIYAV